MLFHYSDKTPSGSLRIFTSESEQSILSRLESVCGQGQFWLNIKMELRAGVSSYRIEATGAAYLTTEIIIINWSLKIHF